MSMAAEGRWQPGDFWQSANFPARQRFEAWQDLLRTVYGALDVDRPMSADFDASVSHHAVGGFQIADCVCDPCAGGRTRRHIRADARETLTLQLMLAGTEVFTFDGETIELGPGDVLIWNSTRPLRFDVTERLHKISVTMPLARLRSWMPTTWHSIDRRLPRALPGAGLLSSVIGTLSPAFLEGTLTNADALTESVMGLLVNVLGPEPMAPHTPRVAQLRTVKAHIDANLGDPDLTPAVIAGACRISLRSLHALFEGEGTTVRQYVIMERLLRCRREFENPRMAWRSITDIAFGWGFQNATHFSRRFKAAFGHSPQDYRAASIMAASDRAARISIQ